MKQLESSEIWLHTQLSRNTLNRKQALLVSFYLIFWPSNPQRRAKNWEDSDLMDKNVVDWRN